MMDFNVKFLTEQDSRFLIEFAIEALEIFQWDTFNEDTDQCEWCLWEPWVPGEHHCLLQEVAEIVDRVKDES